MKTENIIYTKKYHCNMKEMKRKKYPEVQTAH
jgi:hypothetical protein